MKKDIQKGRLQHVPGYWIGSDGTIATALEQYGLSHSDFADICGVNRWLIGDIVRGNSAKGLRKGALNIASINLGLERVRAQGPKTNGAAKPTKAPATTPAKDDDREDPGLVKKSDREALEQAGQLSLFGRGPMQVQPAALLAVLSRIEKQLKRIADAEEGAAGRMEVMEEQRVIG